MASLKNYRDKVFKLLQKALIKCLIPPLKLMMTKFIYDWRKQELLTVLKRRLIIHGKRMITTTSQPESYDYRYLNIAGTTMTTRFLIPTTQNWKIRLRGF